MIEASKSDSWEQKSEIEKVFRELVDSRQFTPAKVLVMVSMGPGAKVFVNELSEAGYTAWDAGQFFDLAYKNIKEL